MNDKFLKPYNPQETEARIYKLWEDSGFFNPDKLLGERKDAYAIMMPPPNATGVLHMGHALTATIEDIMIRYQRMRGKKTLWLPGTDHAAIATQSKVEKIIKKEEGKSRYDLGREELLKRIDKYVDENRHTIVSQTKTLGASCDWSREAFTLDEKRNLAVRTVFKKMYDDGLIYRGNRIVNWDPKGQTTISDDEIVYVEEKTKFYYFKYGPFIIGTTRPETKFGDKYVVMHPDDKRYAEYKDGQKIDLEWINGPISATIIKDKSIDMSFGTGVMTITPWHSLVDFEIGQRHNLDKEQIIDKYGRLLPIAGEFTDMKIAEARPKILEKLRNKGLIVKEEDYAHNVATAERTGGIVEPQIMEQWFVAVNKSFKIPHSEISGIKSDSMTTLKEIMKNTVEKEQIKIIPDYFNKTYFHWIENLNDWCISRQIWYGHRIPVWYRSTPLTTGKESEIYCGLEAPKGDGWAQDEDTLDTWFSSALWTFSTLGWPQISDDLKRYHPTDVLETAYEILFFWVARMIMMTGYTLGTIPFRIVYLHGLIRDAKGRKMSKSLNNGIDPIDIVSKFGADASRMALVVGNTPGTDSKWSDDKVKAYKNFANKIWNITRFILESVGETKHDEQFKKFSAIDKELIKQQKEFVIDITKDMEEYRFYMASEKIYHYIWHTLADIILEESKKIFKNGAGDEKMSRKQFLLSTLRSCLKILHPFMPFLTEEIWQSLPDAKGLLIVENWPIEK